MTRIPVMKNRPHGQFSKKAIEEVHKRVSDILEEEEYKPDFILGHFLHPSLEIISQLKEDYPEALTTVSLHGEEKEFHQEVESRLSYIGMIGYRSYPIKKAFESLYGERPCFMCFSGVPENFISRPKTFEKGINRFVYVGSFIDRKYPEVLVPAIHDAMNGEDATITYVGSGSRENIIRSLARKLNMDKAVKIVGRLPREQVTQELDKTDVFIMISKAETFGLVYLEAMARGCIVVASRNEGMDGIIKNGENGYLCEAGNSTELTEIIKRIRNLRTEEQNAISECAIATAKAFSDSIVAKNYIQAVESYKQ